MLTITSTTSTAATTDIAGVTVNGVIAVTAPPTMTPITALAVTAMDVAGETANNRMTAALQDLAGLRRDLADDEISALEADAFAMYLKTMDLLKLDPEKAFTRRSGRRSSGPPRAARAAMRRAPAAVPTTCGPPGRRSPQASSGSRSTSCSPTTTATGRSARTSRSPACCSGAGVHAGHRRPRTRRARRASGRGASAASSRQDDVKPRQPKQSAFQATAGASCAHRSRPTASSGPVAAPQEQACMRTPSGFGRAGRRKLARGKRGSNRRRGAVLPSRRSPPQAAVS